MICGEHRVFGFHTVNGPADEKCRGGILIQCITGELLTDELIERLVGVESLNDVIAIRPGIVTGAIGFKAIRLGKADDIKPVARPFFAEAR